MIAKAANAPEYRRNRNGLAVSDKLRLELVVGFLQDRAKNLEVDDLEQLFQAIALRRQLTKPILDSPKPQLPRRSPSPSFLGAKSSRSRQNSRGFRRLPLYIPAV